jgi:hypothetical protein
MKDAANQLLAGREQRFPYRSVPVRFKGRRQPNSVAPALKNQEALVQITLRIRCAVCTRAGTHRGGCALSSRR